MHRLTISILLVVVLVVVGGGCGEGSATSPPSNARVATGGPDRYLDERSAEVRLGNAFHGALYRLAVMTQPGDDAADLGQSLPTGTVDATDCRPATSAPDGTGRWAWGCSVRWHTVDGREERERYKVTLTRTGCLYARSEPRLEQIWDATTHAPAEHPLDMIDPPVKGC